MTAVDLTTDDRVEQEGATFATLRSRSHPGLVLVRKASVGRRSDAINAALRVDEPEQALDALAMSAGLRVTRLPLGVAIVSREAAH